MVNTVLFVLHCLRLSRDVAVARDVYETAALLSIKQENSASFEKHSAQGKSYYIDYASVLEPSADQNLLLSLSLMQKLAENRIAEFHTELELVPTAARADPTLAFVLRLEQYLMEGSYASITAPGNAPPHPAFDFFMSLLMVTVRDEIAACSESAYKHVSVAIAKKLLSLSSDEELAAFAAARKWNVVGDTIHFVDAAEQAPSMDQVPSEELIKRALAYAQRLEQIV